MFCGAFTTRMKPKLTTNCSSMVMPTMLMSGVATPCSTAMTIGIMADASAVAGKAKMNHGEKQAQHRQHEQRRGIFETEFGDREIGQKGSAFGLQQRGADADADAEQYDRAPGNPGLGFLPGHDSDARQEHQRHRRKRGR